MDNSKLDGAQALLKTLDELGIEYIFGYSGGAALPIFDALETDYDPVCLDGHDPLWVLSPVSVAAVARRTVPAEDLSTRRGQAAIDGARVFRWSERVDPGQDVAEGRFPGLQFLGAG